MSGATTDPAELLSASQVAALLHLRKQDVLDLVANGTIPSVVIGRHRRVLRASLIDWLRGQERCAPTGAPSAGNLRALRGGRHGAI